MTHLTVKVKDNYVGQSRPYPKLMKGNSGSVVLFEEACKGTVVVKGALYDLGYHACDWAMEFFEDYVGTIELEQE